MASLAIDQHRPVLESQQVNERLTVALHVHIAIEQAKGVVSERIGLNLEQCFSLLRNHAANHQVRLVDLAHTIVDGTVDPGALDPLN